ncbi:MAG: T9SS type A sorting domain-containing protein [Rhodothermales bacterium]|nr:T9SS type A sorting domain-containing protein [Rhodothermales bacterium]
MNWAIPHWVALDDEGADQLSADLKTIIQEIVDRGGWASGNDIAILATLSSGSGTRTAEAYDGEPAAAPEITITYTTDTTPPSAPVITQPTTPTTDNTPVISGTASEDGGTITLTSDLDGVLAPTGTVTGGAWSITLTTQLSNGTHSLTATHTDDASNVSSASGAKNVEVDAPLVVSISASSDDAEEVVSDGSMSLTGNVLEHIDNSGTFEQEYIGLRFQNITIPKGATIDVANIQYTVHTVDADVAITVTYTGEDIDDAPTFTSTANDISGRTQTTASVDWSPSHWAAVDDQGAAQKTADLSTIINEIVDRSGWVSGNDIVIIVKPNTGSGRRQPKSYDNSAADAPELSIEYTPDTTAPTAPVVTQPTTPTVDTTPTISGTASEDGGTITLTSSLDGVLAPTATVSGGTWSIALTTVLSEGSHSLTATHTDAAGNVSSASGGKTLVVDIPPTPVIASTETSPSKADPVPFTVDFGEAIDTGTFSLADITVNSGTKQSLVNTGNDQNWTFEVASPTDGTTLTVSIPADVLTDTGGTNNLVSNTVNITIDRTAPSAPVITQPSTPTGDTTPPISGTASEDGGTITLTSDLDGVLTPTATVASGAWSLTITSALSVGTHSITATHTDGAGNVSSASGGKSIEIQNLTVLTVAVSASSDDAEQAVSGGGVDITSSDLELPYEGAAEQYIGMRFQNITVPVGATITEATIQFQVDETAANDAVTLTFYGEDVDDAATFTITSNDIWGRTRTTASVNWAVPHWAAVDDEGADQKTDDLATIIQEIVDRSGWTSGNDIVIVAEHASGTGTRIAEAYDGEPAAAPEITISYTPDTTAPTAPVVTQPTSPDTDSTPTISGTASEDGGTITLTSDVDGVLAPTATVSGGTWSVNLTTALSNATHSITATHTDAAGNVSSASGAKTLVIDAPLVVAVAASADDAEETLSSGAVLLTGNVLELPEDAPGSQDLKGMRFQNITIPSGATIDSANIQFHVHSTTADVAVTVTFVGEDIDDAPTFTTTTYDISGRTETTASVNWAIPHWVAVDDEGSAQQSPDLATIIQEIVDRSGWASGNDIVIMVKASSGSGKRNPDSWDYSNADAPELTIAYTADTTAPTAPVITQPTTPDTDRTPTISGTASEDGGTITLTSDVDGVLAPTATVSGGTWSIALTSSLSITTHSLTATHTDIAGNESSASGAKTLKITEGISHDRRLYMVTIDDVSSSGAPGLDNWGEDDVLEFSDGSLLLEPSDTDGELSLVPSGFDALFDDGSVAIFSLHYVSIDLTVGSGGNTFDLERGDLLFSLEEDETIGADSFGDQDVHVLRPTTAGDYSAGTFYHLLDDITTGDIHAMTLVEYDTYVGDTLLNAGEFLFTDGALGTEIRHFAPTGVGIGTTSGTTSTFLNTTGDFTVASGFDSLELIETSTTIGGQTLAAGTILASVLGNTGAVGNAPSITVEDEDIFQLSVSTTFMENSSSSATASALFDGSKVSLSDSAEDLKGVTIWQPAPQAFRSRATGNWSAGASWERYNGTDWITAGNFPWSSEAAAVTVQSGHTITVDSSVGDSLTVDQLTVSSGGTVVVDQRTVVVDGSGTDVTVAGTLTINASKEFTPTGASAVSVSSDGVVSNAGTFNADGTSTVTFTSGGTYTHNQNGGAFPQAARTTWSSGSTAQVTGVTTTVPTELGDLFHHFTWNSASQSANLDLNAAITAIAGDLTIGSTGGGSNYVSWVQNANTNLTVGGALVISGGTFVYTDGSGTGTLSATDVTISGAGRLSLTTSTGTPTLDIDEDLVVSGGGVLTETGTGSGTITFTGSAQQDVTAASGISNSVDITVNNTGGILLLSDFSAPADLTATSGAIDAGGYDIYVGADLTITSDLTNGAAVIFNGASGNQNVSYAPGTWSIPSLDVNKAAGSLLLGTNATITTTSCITSGTLDVNGQTLTFPTGTTLYNGGTVTGNVVFERNYAEVGDGWRMIASPLDGVNYSSLNTNFHTQGATWADFSDGTATLQSADFVAQDWTEITGADAAFADGDGYIFYMYETLLGSTMLPATWSVTGTVRTSANKSLSWNTVSTDSYNYVGNRTTGNIDWDAAYAASTNVASTYSTWDPALTTGGGLTGYKYYNQATGTGLAGRYIAPFTAFMVEPTASGGTLVYSTSCAANQGSANYFGKRSGGAADSTARDVTPHIRLMVEGEGMAELETYFAFDSEATNGPDPFDGNRMRPLSRDFVTIASLEGDRQLVFDGRSMDDGLQEYTLGVAATQPGLYTLTWPDWHEIPEHWMLILHDRSDGRRIDLRQQEALTFRVGDDDIIGPSGGGHAETPDLRPRFDLQIGLPGRIAETRGPVPDVLTLAQNYPNPFNPVTSIRYALPEAANVRLEVFDALGRRVASLVNGNQEAGWHDVRWDAGNQPSGLYFYRLTSEEAQWVKTMVLLR